MKNAIQIVILAVIKSSLYICTKSNLYLLKNVATVFEIYKMCKNVKITSVYVQKLPTSLILWKINSIKSSFKIIKYVCKKNTCDGEKASLSMPM